jgi:lysophospholipase L1-like esterase
MATGEKPPGQDRTPWAPRHLRPGHLTRAGRISASVIAAFALTLGVFAVHSATRQSPARTLYIALGDSYAAGDGASTALDIAPGCKRSSRSYPELVARKLGLKSSQYRDASCASAKIANLTAPQPTGSATHPPQLSALSPDATLVTLSIGGNDLDYSGILTRCVELDVLGVLVAKIRHTTDNGAPCRTWYTSAGTDEIRQKTQAVSVALAAALARIHGRAPHARVLVVGYPDLLPAADGAACTLVLGITAADVAYLNNAELHFNRMLARQAAAAGDGYIDAYTPSIGHDTCASPSTRWIEPLLHAAPAVPLHPNASGQQGIAAAVERAIAP